MDTDKQSFTDIKPITPQYNRQNSLNDDDLVDMNEIIKCNIDNWDEICPDESKPVISQEIKLESYNFMGNKINYDDDCQFDDSFNVPEHYFNTENNIEHIYESDEDDVVTPVNIKNVETKLQQNGVINLTDENSDDDVTILNTSGKENSNDDVMIVNTSNNTAGKENEESSVSNSVLYSNLVSIRSDHNYSSQEVFVGSPNESSIPNIPPSDIIECEEAAQESVLLGSPNESSISNIRTDKVIECTEPSECETKMQSLISNLMNDQSKADQINILTDLENEVKRLKSTILAETHQDHQDNVTDPEIPNDYNAKPATDDSDSSEANDSNYIMSEGHSEPLEYHKITNQIQPDSTEETLIDDVIGVDADVTMKEDLNLAVDVGTSDQCVVNTDESTCEKEIPKDDVSANVENNNGISKPVDQCAQENEPTNDETSDHNASVEFSKNIMDKIETVRSVIERVSSKLISFSQMLVNKEVTNEKLKKHLHDLSESGQEFTKSIKAISHTVDAEIHKNVDENLMAEDKARKLNDKSKKRWLASSSEDVSTSEDSMSESPVVTRRKKRTRALSTLPSEAEDESNIKHSQVECVLNDISGPKAVEDTLQAKVCELSESEQEKLDLISKTILDKRYSTESQDDMKDLDMSKYLLPAEVTTEVLEDKICDDDLAINEPLELSQDEIHPDLDVVITNEIAQISSGSDVEMEEFLGFDGSTSDEVIPSKLTDDLIPSTLTKDVIPSTLTDDVIPSTLTDDVIPSTLTNDVIPSTLTNDVIPSTLTDNVIPSKLTDSVIPSTLTDGVIPSTLTDDVNEEINDPNEMSENYDICDMANDVTEFNVNEEESRNDNDHESNHIEDTEPTTDVNVYPTSQEWDVTNDDVLKDAEAKEDIPDEQQSCKENENDADDEKEDDIDEDDIVEDDYDSDKEIDRLVDLSTIPTKSRPIANYVPIYKKKSSSKPRPKEDILDILKDSTSQELDSDSSEEEECISEEQYILQLAKQKLLMSSSEDRSDEDDTEIEDNESHSSIDDPTDESNDSKLNSFLKKRMVNEINDDFETGEQNDKSDHKDDVGEDASELVVQQPEVDPEPEPEPELQAEPSPDFLYAAEPNPETEPEPEPELELRSSGIFEPEIELRDGDKLSEKDEQSDMEKDNEDESQDTKSESSKTEEKKKWKLDKIAFNKNLFSNLDSLDEKENDAHVINSDNSDCEMLDISMFKTKNTTGDLDKIIQNQKKRDVTKISKVADECISLSSDSDLEIDKGIIDDDSEDEKPTKSRPMLRNDQLAGETKQAQKEETDRLKRLDKKIERLTQIVESQSEKLTQSNDDSDVILDFDSKRNCAISVHPEIVKNLKEHQIAGVKFMYDCCYGSVDSIDKHVGSGCILAHCMGLGKTLQLIALLHTLIRYPQLKTKKILVICPKSTIMNWADEIQIWLRSVKVNLKVLHFPDPSDINKKLQILREWHSFKSDPEGRAGCLLIGYEAFRSLVFYYKKPKPELPQVELDRIKKQVDEYLLKPGADLVVCDEGHVIKNRKSTTSLAVNQIKSRRRIILTGTPIQNNLKEYYSMVNFIKPSFLGTEKEFANLYENPIKEGQHKDSDKQQIRIMKQRSYVLHKKLSKFVQRREAALLKTFLPEKYEYVLFIPMTELQNRLYQHFLDNNPLKEKYGGKSLIPDYTFLRKIWTHPKVLENAWKNAVAQRDKRIAARKRNMESDEEPDDVLDSQIGKMSVENDWWRQFIEPHDLRSLLPSNKLRILFEILKLCQQHGEKCLIFSAFVAVLDVVEFFMQQIHENRFIQNNGNDLGLDNFHGPWVSNHDYYRLDGKTSKILRHAMIQNFNNPQNTRVKCFLISAKAGGQGINLTGANRVILLDTSWNPSNDQQNIFRVFRLGQQRKCYIYRLLAMGTMEEKVYSRSVTKQAMSFRVVDEQQIDRHYSMAELAELYKLTISDPEARPKPSLPADYILASLLRNFGNLVYKYHEHDSLLENNSAEDLNDQEKADAWAAYENDVSMKNPFGNINMTVDGMYNNPYNSLNMGLNMMNPYNYIPPNLPTNLIPSYLQRMGYSQSGVEQELMLMSQMYSSPFNTTSGPTSGYGALASLFNSPPSSSTNPLFNSPTSGSNNYFKPNISPITTSSSSAYTNNMTTPISPSVFNGINALSSTSSATPQNMMYNLARLMPSYGGLTGSSNQTSSPARPSSSAISSAYPSPYNLYGGPSNTNATNSAQSTTQPGPNAIKNPLLSNLLPPPTSNTKDPFSIPTSVITKASKDLQRNPVSLSPTHPQGNRSSSSTNAVNQLNSVRPSSAHSNHSSSPSLTMTKSMTARGSPLTAARSSPSSAVNSPSAARSSPSAARSSPSAARSSPLTPKSNSAQHQQQTAQQHQQQAAHQHQQQAAHQHQQQAAHQHQQQISQHQPQISQNQRKTSQQLQQASQQQRKTSQQQNPQLPLSITLAGNRSSPEPNIIVKDVMAINRTVERKGGPSTSTSKTSTTPIKNFNMGIVYPKALDKKSFDLSQNDKLLRAAQDQLNSLRSNSAAQNVGQNSSSKSGISQLQQQPNRSTNRPATISTNRTNDSRSSVRVVDKNVASSVSALTKSNLASTLPTNEVTITPTRRLQKVTAPTTVTGQQKTITTTSITPSINRKTSLEVNKLSNLPISTLSTVSRLPASTSITRQTTMPTGSGNANTIAGRVSSINHPSSINSKTSKPMPTLSRQGSLPTLKLISQPTNSNKQSGLVRTANPTTSTSIASRAVTHNLNQNGVGITKSPALVQRVPKLVTFPTASNAERKRKLEEMIPLNSGITLTVKKPRIDSVQKPDNKPGIKRSSFVGLPAQPKSTSRPKGQSMVEIVELD